jgi:hypothetical protein
LHRIIAAIEAMDTGELAHIQAAIDRRSTSLKQSSVLERRNYRDGILQLETRAYRRRDGGLTERGPYWYFKRREGGRQRTIYVGKADNPEAAVDERLKREE